MIKLLKLLLSAQVQTEKAYAAFLSTAGSAILFGTAGVLALRYLRHVQETEEQHYVLVLEEQRDGIEAELIKAGVFTRADVDKHGVLVALRQALEKRASAA